ncbi:tautomerase family protein [Herbaspirillum sp. meg3]|uniref:tautomerase family protein n=1 Tax=Herbaspirillum sp. meg3 TaxID=2025949 RepID=UPI000B98FB4B|nr:tautomerase family protein [Herbaspirillum sp. meg3]ASU39718.1 tautomerase family protein [Herbaspirillum sp. meg3]
MPFVRVHIRRGETREYRKAILDNIYEAMLETFNVPKDDKFMVVDEYDPDNFVFDKTYLNIARSDKFVLIQITANNTRTIDQKKALYARIVERLGEDPGIRSEDVFISLVEVLKENWSFGNGLAQYAL